MKYVVLLEVGEQERRRVRNELDLQIMMNLAIYIAVSVMPVAALVLMPDSDEIVLASYIAFAECRACRANSNPFKEDPFPLLDRVKKVFVVYVNILDPDIKVFC